MCLRLDSLLIADRDYRIVRLNWNGETLLPHDLKMFLHAPPSLVETVLNGVADTAESLKVRRVEAEKIRFAGSFDYQGEW